MVNTNNISNSKSFYKGITNLLPISKFTNLILLCERNKIADQILINRISEMVNSYRKLNKNCSILFNYSIREQGTKLKTVIFVCSYIVNKCRSSIVLKTVKINQFFLMH
nr:unnamed protein product [Callosobruchus analis]